MKNKKYQEWIDNNIVRVMDEYGQYLQANSITNYLIFLSNKEISQILVNDYFNIKFYNDQERIDFIKYFNEYFNKNANKIRMAITCLSLLKN